MSDTRGARRLIERLFRDHPTKRFAVRLWDGTEISWGSERDFTLVLHDPDTLRFAVRTHDPNVLAQAYVTGRLDIEGDVSRAAEIARYLGGVELGLADKLRLAVELGVPTSRHRRDDDARDVRAHYDLPEEFFRLFLDERLVYSCAYFAHPEQSLEEAQARKLDLVCRKLNLHAGELVLDLGCGWGALPCWAADHYGVAVYGITLSRRQVEAARRRSAGRRVTIDERHYEELPEAAYDKIASIGMYEHVGIARYPKYFSAVHRALRPGGLFLNHGITSAYGAPTRIGGEFIWRHVFPGAEIAEVWRTVRAVEEAGFEILDVQSLRPHYALTLREWAKRFAERRIEAARIVPEQTLRVWDLYLSGCADAFEDGRVDVHQILGAKLDDRGAHRAPFTREEMLLPFNPGVVATRRPGVPQWSTR